MTEYNQLVDHDAVADRLNTHGIVSEEFLAEDTGIEWVSGVSPSLLRDVADLVEFCYPDTRTVDVGLVAQPNSPEAAPALVFGDPDDDRYVMLAAKQDCKAGARGGDAE